MAATQDLWYKSGRLGGLRRFAAALTTFNILGHTVFGFEQSLAQPLAALAAGYGMEIVLETVGAWASGRRPRFRGGPLALLHFLLPAHITGLAVAMLLYANDRVMPVVFAVVVAIASKYVFRIGNGGFSRHFLNPSNLGISITLILFPWVGIAPPYHFTENLSGAADWILPGVIVVSGSFLNFKFTRRWPLITAWLGTFALQAVVRSWLYGSPVTAALLPMTGVAFLLFTFYMVTDPPTTPGSTRDQILFGAAVAVAYHLLMRLHVVFGLFFALSIVCLARGILIYTRAWVEARSAVDVPAGPALERSNP